MGYEFELDEEIARVQPTGRPLLHPSREPGGLELMIDGRPCQASLRPGREPGEYLLTLDGREERVWIASRGDLHFVHLRGRAHRVHAVNSLERARRAAEPSGGAEILRAPMPGVVVDVVARAGDAVDVGQLLMTIESMKLQTAITAPHAAIVAEVYVSTGASFDQGATLVRLESAAEEAASQEGDAK